MLISEVILTHISNYLKPIELIILSSINKSTYDSKLNPIKNPIINTLYRKYASKKLYFNDILDEDIDAKNEEEILDNYYITNNNWKFIYFELIKHNNNYHYENKRDCVKRVYELFQNHLYLPFIRKANYILENKESSLHQLYCYDFYKNGSIVCIHFDKYLDTKINGFLVQNPEKFIMRKNLFFENELLYFNDLARNVFSNNQFLAILEKLVIYDYEGIDALYCSNNMDGVKDPVFDFVLWLNHSAILFSKFLYNQMKVYLDNKKNGIDLVKHYIKNHDNFINFSLSVNENFNNLNIIINYLYRFTKDKTKQYYDFSIYKMFFNIMKKEIYNKLNTFLKQQFQILVEQYCKELFGSVTKERTQSFDSGTKQDSDDSFEEDDDLELKEYDSSFEEEENKELSKKETIDIFMRDMVDYNINEKNALCINHSMLKMEDDYIEYENILINSFVKEIDNAIMKEKKPIENIYQVVKSLFSVNHECYKKVNLEKYYGFKFIRKTKREILKKIEQCLERNIKQNLKNGYYEYSKNNKNTNEKSVKNKKINYEINQITKDLIDELNEEEKSKMENLYKEKIDEIKKELMDNNSKQNNCYTIVYKLETINNYLDSVALDNIKTFRDILYSFFVDKKLCIDLDNKILQLLNNNVNVNNSIII